MSITSGSKGDRRNSAAEKALARPKGRPDGDDNKLGSLAREIAVSLTVTSSRRREGMRQCTSVSLQRVVMLRHGVNVQSITGRVLSFDGVPCHGGACYR